MLCYTSLDSGRCWCEDHEHFGTNDSFRSLDACMTQCLLNAMITTTTATTNTNLSSQDHTKITSFVVAITGGCLLLLSRCWLFLLVRSWHRFLLFFLTCSCHLFICHLAFGRNGWINCRIRIPEKKHQTMIILTQYMISLCFGKRKRERENTYT